MKDRYSRQVIFPEIGEAGQQKLGRSSAVIIGCGALGTVIASTLVRAGVGKIRIIDRDFIEYHNLQRQILFDENDIELRLPKAIAAERHLKTINSSIQIEGIVSDVNYTNIEDLVAGFDVILDGLDNLETRYLVNDVALKKNIPWIYGAAVSSLGMSLTVVPHKTPCLQCFSSYTTGSLMTCDTSGVIGPAPLVIGALQSVEALKILVGSEDINRSLLSIDIWNNDYRHLKINFRDDCPSCHDRYVFLDGKFGSETAKLCGQNAVQVRVRQPAQIDFRVLSGRLAKIGKVDFNEFLLNFNVDGRQMVVFPDGRAIVNNTSDEMLARGLYAKYIGS
jgi:molybdopterin-synthase adenylyltransferase